MPRTKHQQSRLRTEIHALILREKDRPCARCKVKYPSVCMDFDHRPGSSKSFSIGSPSNWTSVSRIKAEIAKCDVVCSNCHRILTWERKYGQPVTDPTLKRPETVKRGKNRLLTAALKHARLLYKMKGAARDVGITAGHDEAQGDDPSERK